MAIAVSPARAESAARAFARHFEGEAYVPASPAAVFDRLDDQERLAKHMRKPSMMMGGGRMDYGFDEGGGRKVGSHIRRSGSAFGVAFDVDEVVTVRDPPRRKVWRTTGDPRLAIIGAYEMGFECEAFGDLTRLRIWIEYDLPRSSSSAGRLLGTVLAGFYARRCVSRVLSDTAEAFFAGTRR